MGRDISEEGNGPQPGYYENKSALGAGPTYTNQDRDRLMSAPRMAATLGDLAEQANVLNARVDGLLEGARSLVDRMGAAFPPSGVGPAGSKVDINGPIDYASQQTALALDKLDDLANLHQAIGSRIG